MWYNEIANPAALPTIPFVAVNTSAEALNFSDEEYVGNCMGARDCGTRWPPTFLGMLCTLWYCTNRAQSVPDKGSFASNPTPPDSHRTVGQPWQVKEANVKPSNANSG